MAAYGLTSEPKVCLHTSIQIAAEDLTNTKSHILKKLKILEQLPDHVTLSLGVFMVV